MRDQEPVSASSMGNVLCTACELCYALRGGAVQLNGWTLPRGKREPGRYRLGERRNRHRRRGGVAITGSSVRGWCCTQSRMRRSYLGLLGRARERRLLGQSLTPTAVNRSPVVDILCMSEQDVSMYAAGLFVRRYLDSISTHKE